MQNAILQPAFDSKIFVLIFHDEILDGAEELAKLARIAGWEKDAQNPGIIKAEIQLLMIFGAYYEEPAEVLVQLIHRIG